MKNYIKKLPIIFSITGVMVAAMLCFCVNMSTGYASNSGGTVTITDQNNSIDETYHHAKIRLLTFYGNGSVTGNQIIIITKDGHHIRPSNDAQITYTHGAIDNGFSSQLKERN